MNPLVSVVIPAYNSAETISRAIQSVLSQTYAPIQIIVVDDGSKDNTEAVVKDQSPDSIYYRQSNAGAGAARNKGVELASGEWIAFLDADDEWHPRKLEIQMTFVAANKNLVFVSNTPLINREGEEREYPDIDTLPQKSYPWRQIEFLRRNRAHTSSVLTRRDVYLRVGGCDPSLINAQDRDLWLKILYIGEGICIDMPLTKYYHHSQGLSRNVVRRFQCDLTLIDRWDSRRPETLDREQRITQSDFCRIKYSVLFTIIFKLLRMGDVDSAWQFWRQLDEFHKTEYRWFPKPPFSIFRLLVKLEQLRKRIKYGKNVPE